MHKFIIANWKSNKSLSKVSTWFQEFRQKITELGSKQGNLQEIVLEKNQTIIAPAYPLLKVASQFINKNNLDIKLSTQDLSHMPPGAYTGAVCVENLQELNINYSIVGHSERRRHFQETDQDVAKKVEQAIQGEITPILCIDEPYLASQLNALKENFDSENSEQANLDQVLQKLIIAYEPINAISTEPGAKNADTSKISKVFAQIKKVYGDLPVIYGGSVNETNVNDYLAIADGVLVGGASLDGKQFAQLVINAA